MQSILEKLYLGNIDFDTGDYCQDPVYIKAAERKRDCMIRLDAILDETGKELFDQYCDAQGDAGGIIQYTTYVSALKFGILLMVELFTSD